MNTDKIVLIAGKGPSLRYVRRGESYEVAALNTASEFCEHIDYLFINDFREFDRQDMKVWDRVKNLIIPTYPHGVGFIPQANMSHHIITDLLPAHIVVHLHELETAPVKDKSIDRFGPVATVGETAVAWLLVRGFRKFLSVGLDPDTCAYHKDFMAKGHKPTSYGDSWRGIQRRLAEVKSATIKRLTIPEGMNVDDGIITGAL